jgi:hypothetical protein
VMAELHERGELGQLPAALAESHVHMHCNRILSSTAEEGLVRGLAARALRGLLATGAELASSRPQ